MTQEDSVHHTVGANSPSPSIAVGATDDGAEVGSFELYASNEFEDRSDRGSGHSSRSGRRNSRQQRRLLHSQVNPSQPGVTPPSRGKGKTRPSSPGALLASAAAADLAGQSTGGDQRHVENWISHNGLPIAGDAGSAQAVLENTQYGGSGASPIFPIPTHAVVSSSQAVVPVASAASPPPQQLHPGASAAAAASTHTSLPQRTVFRT